VPPICRTCERSRSCRASAASPTATAWRRPLGFDDASASTVAVSRIAGGRDIALGVATVAALSDPDRLRRASLACAFVDAGDAAAFAAAAAEDDDLRAAAIRGMGAAIPAAIAGLWVALRLR
jgi:hypothetical protein